MARPTDDPKTYRLDLRFAPHLVEKVDEWRRVQRDIPARAEAIRRLVQRGIVFNDVEAAFFLMVDYIFRDFKDAFDLNEEQMNIFSRVVLALDGLNTVSKEDVEGMIGDDGEALSRFRLDIVAGMEGPDREFISKVRNLLDKKCPTPPLPSIFYGKDTDSHS